MRSRIVGAVILLLFVLMAPLGLSNDYLRSRDFDTITVKPNENVWSIAARYVSDEKKPKSQIIDLPNTKRHVIRVNDISAKARTYVNKSTMRTDELITGAPVSSIAIFANEYVPYHYPDNQNYIQYIITINGEDYDITPINSYKTGKKIFRCTEHSYLDTYVQKLPENIKSAKLTVIIQSPEDKSAPYVTNLKVCLGKAVTKD